jgi:hypothetical protein
MYVKNVKSNQRLWGGAVQGFVQEDFNLAERKEWTKVMVKIILVQFFK